MPDTLMREALAKLPQVEADLAAARKLIGELVAELRVALPYTNKNYTLHGHHMRVMIRYLDGDTNDTT